MINVKEICVSCDQKNFRDETLPKPVNLLVVDLCETYPDILIKVSSNVSGFIHHNSGVRCGTKTHSKSKTVNPIFSECCGILQQGLYRGIPSALSYSNCAKTRQRPLFDHCSHWIRIYRRVSLTGTGYLNLST